MSKKSIFLVDDDPDDRYLARIAIVDTGVPVDVQEFSSVQDAWRELSDVGGVTLPDLVILDLNMPESSGFDLLALIRKTAVTALLPCVVYSTSTDSQDINHSYQLGANSFVVKPLSYQDTKKTFQSVCSYWLSTSVTPGTDSYSTRF